MELRVVIAGRAYAVDLGRPMSLAIPLRFDGPQPSLFGAAAARATPFSLGGFIGDTRQGGSCNVAEIRMVPHCNGTHTESVGHIVDDDAFVSDALPQSLMPAVVISVWPAAEDGDAVITRRALSDRIDGYRDDELAALIVRTLPNDASKMAAVYGEAHRPPFFTADGMGYLVMRGVRHLLADIPSIDRMFDQGRLANHRIFWNLAEGARAAAPDTRSDSTVTEMVFVSDEVADGLYLLNLQLPAFQSDAAPSRPVVYALQ